LLVDWRHTAYENIKTKIIIALLERYYDRPIIFKGPDETLTVICYIITKLRPSTFHTKPSFFLIHFTYCI